MKSKTLLGSLTMIFIASAAVVLTWWGGSQDAEVYTPRAERERAAAEWRESELVKYGRLNMNTGEYQPEDVLRAKQKVERRLSKRSSLNLNWQEMGPSNVGGRTRSIIVDRDNSNRLYAAGVSGGIFISDDGGGRWAPYDDLMDNLIVSTMVQASNGDIYVGTGCTFEGSAPQPGGGIWKSTDGGSSFNRLTSTLPDNTTNRHWQFINRITVNPNNPNEVFAGTFRGLYASSDGGQTWEEQLFLANCQVHGVGEVEDLEYLPGGRLLVGYGGGVYITDTPFDECSYLHITDGIPASTQRIDMDFCDLDENRVVAITVSGGFLEGVYESDDQGETWKALDPAPPTASIDSTFELFGDNGQGNYDLAIELFPNNCDRMMIGGVQLYRVAGSWSRVAEIFASPISGVYVHADKHYFEFDPKDPNTLYIGSDGGISKTTNASAPQPDYFPADRGYNVTQYYGIAFAPDGSVFGGTQDNGTHWINPNLPGESGTDATQVQGGDGFDCAISNVGGFAFVTSQFNGTNRLALPASVVPLFEPGSPYVGEGRAPFHSVVRLWESTNDLTSQDSVTFNNDTVNLSLAKGNGTSVSFNGTMLPVQEAASLIPGTVRFTNRFGSISQRLEDSNLDGILYDQETNDSAGVYDYATGQYSFRFRVAPPDQSDILGGFAATYDAGDTLRILSATANFPFVFVLPNALNVGDSVRIQDIVQSLFISAVNGGMVITRDALKEGIAPAWIDLRLHPNWPSLTPRAVEFSDDGNHMYFGGFFSGAVYRVSGLNDLYEGANLATTLTVTEIFDAPAGGVAGLVMHPSDPEKLLVTLSGYGNGGQSHVFELTNAQSSLSESGTIDRDVQGDLVDMPVFDGEYDVRNPEIVLLATDFGIWSTRDINATNVEWVNENATLANVPVYDIKQQRLAWNQAANHEVIYAGTHGRGIWSSGALVNSTPEWDGYTDNVDLGLKIYPNPVDRNAQIQFNLGSAQDVNFRVFDLNGKVVRDFDKRRFEAGANEFQFNAEGLPAGTYFMTVSADSQYSMAKFVVVK